MYYSPSVLSGSQVNLTSFMPRVIYLIEGDFGMRRFFSFICFSAIGTMAFCSQAAGSLQMITTRSPLPKCTLPDPVKSHLSDRLKDYEPVEKRDYEPEIFDHVDNRYINWVLCADFDGNGQEDYALLMKKEGEVFLVVVRKIDDSYVHDMLLRNVKTEAGVVLMTNLRGLPCLATLELKPAGLYQVDMVGVQNPKMKKLKNPAILSRILETDDDWLWYWEKGRWHTVFVGL